jgi:hypothetical protein
MRRRPTEERTPRVIRFVHEQDGEPEREVKALLARYFEESGTVVRAYLARVDYGEPDAYDVALCVVTPDGRQDPEVLNAVARIFGDLFSTKEHLDTLFLTPARERELAAVCRPFFARRYS